MEETGSEPRICTRVWLWGQLSEQTAELSPVSGWAYRTVSLLRVNHYRIMLSSDKLATCSISHWGVQRSSRAAGSDCVTVTGGPTHTQNDYGQDQDQDRLVLSYCFDYLHFLTTVAGFGALVMWLCCNLIQLSCIDPNCMVVLVFRFDLDLFKREVMLRGCRFCCCYSMLHHTERCF